MSGAWAATDVTLEGRRVRLEPMTADHVDALCTVGLDDRVWEWNPSGVHNRDDMVAYVEAALAERARGTALPFVTVEMGAGTVVGSTRFGNIDPVNRHVEIGWTWLGPRWWRTGLNVEAKRLQLGHAFETWRCLRVEFKTDALNERSRVAIARLGARFEGVLRHHMVTSTERMRDSAYYSILADEWPNVRSRLEADLSGPAA